MKKLSIAIAFLFLGGTAMAQINLGKLKEKANEVVTGNTDSPGLTNEEVVEGLKEALSVGTDSTTLLASAADGFYKNPEIFIPFPEDAIKVKEKAAQLGMQNQVDKFVLTMNRAAEEASKEAGPIFLDAIKSMSVTDGFTILKGENNAATIFLDKATREALRIKFTPIVKAAIEKVEVTKYWNPLVSKYNKTTMLTGGEKVDPDIDAYITEKALDGLFILLAEEELKIRENPLARVSNLLQKVFGSLDK